MRSERRRGRGVWRTIVEDPYRKLIAIGLAVLMWYFVNSRVLAKTYRRLPLVVVSEVTDRSSDQLMVHLPNARVAGSRFLNGGVEIHGVDVEVTGPRFLIDAIEDETMSLVVTRNVRRGEAGDVDTLEFTAADIKRDLLLKDVSIKIDPPRIWLEYEIWDNFVVELPENEGLLKFEPDPAIAARVRSDRPVFSPQSVTVVGPAADILKLQKRRGSVPLFRARLPSVNTPQVSALLQLIDVEGLDLRIDPPTTVTVELMPLTGNFTLEVPVFVDDLSLPAELRSRYLPENETMVVPLQASGSLLSKLTSETDGKDPRQLRDWARRNFRLLVHLEMPPGGVPLPEVLEAHQAHLVPTGDLLSRQVDYKVTETVTVTLRRQ